MAQKITVVRLLDDVGNPVSGVHIRGNLEIRQELYLDGETDANGEIPVLEEPSV